MGALERTHRGKGIAAAAVFLVLDLVDGVVIPPVPHGQVGRRQRGRIRLLADFGLFVSPVAQRDFEFFIGPGRELVVAKLVRSEVFVLLVDVRILLHEEVQAELVLFRSREREIVLLHVGLEAGLHEVLSEGKVGTCRGLDAEIRHRVT